jgi:branched-chain amino acid transport system substrate-binding protein
VKQAAEFGLPPKQTLAGLFTQIVDVDSMGLAAAHGLLVTEGFYWDLNDATPRLLASFRAAVRRADADGEPSGVYSSVLAYLHAPKAANSIVGKTVVAELQRALIRDALFGMVTVRKDGRAVHDMYTFRARSRRSRRGGGMTTNW